MVWIKEPESSSFENTLANTLDYGDEKSACICIGGYCNCTSNATCSCIAKAPSSPNASRAFEGLVKV